MIKAALRHIPIPALAPHHVATFRDARAQQAPHHVRNEMACLSAALTWAVESKKLASSVAKKIRRPRRKVRERLITHDEYLSVYARAVCVRMLGLPADVLRLRATQGWNGSPTWARTRDLRINRTSRASLLFLRE